MEQDRADVFRMVGSLAAEMVASIATEVEYSIVTRQFSTFECSSATRVCKEESITIDARSKINPSPPGPKLC